VSERAVILAGGEGTRMAPYTTVLPKPLLPIGNRAILEIVIEQLRATGFTDVTMAVGYLAHLIQAVFRDGSEYGVAIDYHSEREPLGTAGALADLERLDEPFLMMNGDVLTTLDYRDLYRAHCEAGNLLTIATHLRRDQSDYGVLHLNGRHAETGRVVGYEEKPETLRAVSMGVYVVEPEAIDYITHGERTDVPDLVLRLIDDDRPVGSYLYDGLWLDIGRHEDYEKATAEYDGLALSGVIASREEETSAWH
jgi:NDP-sugar pyrophosphorylase family protein